jgi:aldose 1-epimerase
MSMITNQSIQTREWGKIADKLINLYTITNSNGIKVNIANFGAAVQSIFIPDKDGGLTDIILGYDSLEGYEDDNFYIGTVVGRYANRIAGGKVNIHGIDYQLTVKDGGFHHHGGKSGFNKKVWQAETFEYIDSRGVHLTYLSLDGEEGFPGNLETTVTYTLNNNNQLIVDYKAVTDMPTILNLTQHIYFNLEGHDKSSILNHKLMLPHLFYLPVNQMQVPEGKLGNVKDTPFDFTAGKAIGQDINANNEQLELSRGYDHSWVVKESRSDKLVLAAVATGPESDRKMNVYTTEPAIHLYTGNFLDGSPGKSNSPYGFREGFCLEAQNYPDSPNHPDFPSSLLNPDEVFTSRTVFEFEWDTK